MRIERPAVISKPIPLVPLVDVVFLLLMFFMLSTTFAKFGQLDVGRGSALSAAGQQGGSPGIIVEISKGPEVRVNGSRVDVSELVAKLDEFYGKGVRRGSVRVAASADVQDLVTILELARTSKLRALSIRR